MHGLEDRALAVGGGQATCFEPGRDLLDCVTRLDLRVPPCVHVLRHLGARARALCLEHFQPGSVNRLKRKLPLKAFL
jgi:hypothetical protein